MFKTESRDGLGSVGSICSEAVVRAISQHLELLLPLNVSLFEILACSLGMGKWLSIHPAR